MIDGSEINKRLCMIENEMFISSSDLEENDDICENFETIKLNVDGKILNPNLLKSQIRNKQRKANRKKTISNKDLQLQKKAAEEFDSIS